MHTNRWLEQRLRGLHWPLSSWTRELITGARETGFSCLPADLQPEVEDACLPGSTLDCESSFNMLKRAQRQDTVRRQSRQNTFYRLVTSTVLSDTGKPQLHASAADRFEDHQIPADSFVAVKGEKEFSLGGSSELKHFMTATNRWPSVSPKHYAVDLPRMCQAFLSTEGMFSLWADMRVCEAVMPGCLIARKPAQRHEVFYVLSTTQDTVTVWAGELHAAGEIEYFAFIGDEDGRPWQNFHITALNDWEAWSCYPTTKELLRETHPDDVDRIVGRARVVL